MPKVFAALPMLVAIAGCRSIAPSDIVLPKAVVGTASSVKFSGWGRNWCSNGEPVKDLYSRPEFNCLMIGGEIYVVRIKSGISLSDMSSLPAFDILVPVAIDSNYPHGIVIVPELAPPDLAEDTGVRYWATKVSFTSSWCPKDKPAQLSANCLASLRAAYADEP